MMRTNFFAVLGVVFLASNALAQLPTPELKSIYPPGAKQGSSVDVTIGGVSLEGPTTLMFAHPGITATQKMAPNALGKEKPVANQFSVAVAADVPAGVYEARVVSRFGVSNPRSFEVGEMNEMMDDGSNKTIDKARPLELGTVVNGRVDAGTRDYYKLTLKAGQRVLVECCAAQLDSRMDATLVVYDASGRELVRDRDTAGLDPLIDFEAPADGDYVVGLYDFVYAGGGDYYYRLAVHSRPHVDFIFPPSGIAGSTGKYTIYGRNLPNGQPADEMQMGSGALQKLTVDITLPKEPAPLLTNASLASAALDGTIYQLKTPAGAANPVTIYFANDPVIAESGDNNDPAKPQKLTVPCEFVGQFYPKRDVDWVQFDAKNGDVFWIDVVAHRLGLDSDPIISVQRVTKDGEGKEVVSDMANVDDPGDRAARIGQNYDTTTDDPSYRFQANADASYRIMIRDQFGYSRKDPRYVYRLLIRKEQPDFRLVAFSMPNRVANANVIPVATPVLRKGGTTLMQINAVRRDGFKGEIEVSAAGLPTGVTCTPVTIGATANSASLIFEAAEDAKAWSGPIQIVGKSKVDGKEIVRNARAGSVVWSTTNRTQIPATFRLTGDLALAVVDAESEVATVKVGDGMLIETSKGGKVELPVKVTRRNDFKGDIKFVSTGAPKELKPADITIKGATPDGKLTIQATNNALKPGFYNFYLKGDVKYKYLKTAADMKVAEENQKEVVAAIADVTAKAKTATDAKNAAVKAATDAANVAKQAADKLKAAQAAATKDAENQGLKDAVAAAQKAVEEANAMNQAAQEAKTVAEKTSADADAKLKSIQALKTAADKRVGDLKKAKPADLTVSVLSNPIRVRIVDSPLKLAATAPGGALKQGAKIELPVTLERLYGFADQVEVTFEPPKGVAGLTVNKVTLPKDQTQGKFEIAANDKATPGDHTVTLRAKAKFNNVTVETTQSVVVKVEKVEPAK